ncbi:MAG: hypothetical protein VB144_05595 [Clostridia bacterium]|nr:hypothetical protein [Clostridia bacterium]
MRSIRSIARYQLVLIARSPLFVVAVLALLVILTVGAVNRADGFPAAPVETTVASAASMNEMALLVFTLLAAWAGTMARSGRASEMTDTYWHTNTEIAIGQALGLFLAFAAVQAVSVVWGTGLVWAAYGRMPVNIAAAVSFWFVQLLPGAVMTAGLGYAVGYLIGSPVVAYPVAAGLWFAVVMGSRQASWRPTTRWLAVLDMGSAHDFDRGLTAVAMVALGLLGAGAAAGLVKRGREAAAGRRLMSAAAVAVTVAAFGLALGASWVRWSPRLEASRNSVSMAPEETRALAGLSALELGLRPATDVRSYDMEVRLHPSQGVFQNTVVMDVINSGVAPLSTLSFTLRGEFAVEGCQVRQGSWNAARCDRRASLLSVQLDTPLAPGQSCAVRISYRGPVQDWTLGKFLWLNTELNGIVRPDRAWLPAGLAWYPVAGARHTRYVAVANGEMGVTDLRTEGAALKAAWVENSHPSACMHVRVHTGMPPGTRVDMGIPGTLISGEGENPVYEFRSDWARDLYLTVGAARQGGVELPDIARTYLDRRWDFYEALAQSGSEIVPANPPTPRLGSLPSSPLLAPSGAMVVNARVVQRLARGDSGHQGANEMLPYDRNVVENAVLGAWWPEGGTRWDTIVHPASEGEMNVINGVLRYALVLFMEHNGEHDAAQRMLEKAEQEYWPGVMHSGSLWAHAELMLEQARKDYGLETVRRVYSLLRAGQAGRDGIVTVADLEATIARAAQEAAAK